MNFNADNGCLKCTVEGDWSHLSNATIFPKFDAPKRTDEGFRVKLYPDHVVKDTPLLELPIDMIKQFVIGDQLHLIDLGVTKKLLTGWKTGYFGYKTKWSANTTERVSEYLKSCQKPLEIVRRIRGLGEISFWKGTEYISIVVLKNHLVEGVYHHFLLYFCAITICSSDHHLSKLSDTAKELLTIFLNKFKIIYGQQFVFSNFHNLIHLMDDIQSFGNLTNFWTYPFENNMYNIKRMLRSGKLPLSQIGKRLIELPGVYL